MTYPILYSFNRCPYAMRARLGLLYAGIVCEIREVDLKNKPSHMLEISPKGTVPVLLLPDGQVLEESSDILDLAISRRDTDGWGDLNPVQKALTDDLVNYNDFMFKNQLNRYKYPSRFMDEWGDFTEQTFSLKNRKEALIFLSRLEELLSANTYLLKDTLSRADIVIIPFIRQFSMVEPDWFANASFPNVRTWLGTFLESDLFKRAMIARDPWKPGDAPILFGV